MSNENFIYTSKDKSFYQDYNLGSYCARIAITYKYGFIECFYSFWNPNNDERFRGRFNSIASIHDEDLKNKLSHNFPIATSIEDLELILNVIIELNNEFIKNLEECI